MRRLALSCLFSFLSVPLASPHDLWLQPDPLRPGAGSVRIRAVVGAVFPKFEETKKMVDYREALLRRGGEVAPIAKHGEDPTLLGEVAGESAFFVSARVPKREIDLKAEEVREYLSAEAGLSAHDVEAVLEGGGSVLHETYSRCIKALVIPRGAKSVPDDLPFGLPLEVVVVKWERGSDPRARLSFRLLRDKEPLADAPVRVLGGSGQAVTVRTDVRGEATARVDPGAPVLVAFASLVGREKGRYETLWTNLAIFDFREQGPVR